MASRLIMEVKQWFKYKTLCFSILLLYLVCVNLFLYQTLKKFAFNIGNHRIHIHKYEDKTKKEIEEQEETRKKKQQEVHSKKFIEVSKLRLYFQRNKLQLYLL